MNSHQNHSPLLQKVLSTLKDLTPEEMETLLEQCTAAILEGKQPSTLQLQDLLRGGLLPLDWNEQRSQLGFV